MLSTPFRTLFLALLLAAPAASQEEVTTASMLDEMADLAHLARWPSPAYHTIQFSSFDRHSINPELPGWFGNSDGFGGESIPGFEAVLRAPAGEGAGLYLLADVEGPGVIVRGWSAGMGGTLRVFLDGRSDPLFQGPGYDFLARRSSLLLHRAGVSIETRDAFSQEDADYFPIPFARHLRVTWEGKLSELHFYHLQVRRYEAGAQVRTFDLEKDLRGQDAQIERSVQALTRPLAPPAGEEVALRAELPGGEEWSRAIAAPAGGGAFTSLELKVRAAEPQRALRGLLLRLRFDGASRPQVECPLGDFFGSGPGINPYESLPISVRPDGLMSARWVMPFAREARLELVSYIEEGVAVEGRVRVAPWSWDERSLHFRAKWRADHDLLAGGGRDACDLPFLFACGRGRLVGLVSILMNPTGIPTPYGSWWGEGDEKIWVDGGARPVALGTGSEDYYNYSWSRPALFAHPYCGQPLDSGPGNSGYVSNHRWQILDNIPFERLLEVCMELYSHTRTTGLSYARMVYHYARPGCRDDHRRLGPADLIVPRLPAREAVMSHGSHDAQLHYFEDLHPRVDAGAIERLAEPLAMRGRVLGWRAAAASRLAVSFPIEKKGRYKVNLVLLHRPDGALVRLHLDGEPLPGQGRRERIALRSEHRARDLNVYVEARALEAGEHLLEIECIEPGFIGLDYLWVQRVAR